MNSFLIVVAVWCVFAAGMVARGPVENAAMDLRLKQATVRLDRCVSDSAARIQRAEDNGAVARAVGWRAVAVAHDMADRVIQGGSREEAARIKHYLTMGAE